MVQIYGKISIVSSIRIVNYRHNLLIVTNRRLLIMIAVLSKSIRAFDLIVSLFLRLFAILISFLRPGRGNYLLIFFNLHVDYSHCWLMLKSIEMNKIRVGLGYDVHRLATGEELWLGGLQIPHEKGTVAHSDGDVLLHALCDALLGATGLRDIGFHFPDTSSEFKNIDSKILLEKTIDLVSQKGYTVVNADIVVVAQRPKLKDYIPEMESVVARILNIDVADVNIKATTSEMLGFEGREEGISVQAVVLLEKRE